MNGRNAVDLEGANDGEVSHAEHLMLALALNDRQLAHHLAIPVKDLFNLQEPATIDFEDDFGNTGHKALHQRH